MPGKARVEKVVIVVFDGLRPDMIPRRMPVLQAFLADGLWFSNARSVFPSVTRVCTTSFATGAWPQRHGIVNNQFHLEGDLTGALVDTARMDHLQALARRSGAIATCDSLGERLSAAGRSMTAIHCGSAGSGVLVNHRADRNGHRTFSVHGADATLTPGFASQVLDRCGPLPAQEIPRTETVAYAGRVATAVAMAEAQSDVTLVWLPEPDTAFHFCDIHSEGALAAMRAADTAFEAILEAVARGPHAGSTAVIAMSDHGQIATSALVDLTALLRADGFRVGPAPADGTDILMTGGNMGELRPLRRDDGLIAELGRWLMSREEIGMVFADPDTVDGALPPETVHQTHPRSAPLLYVMHSDTSNGPGGLPGRGLYTGGVPLGGGMHGGLNRYEMNTVLGFAVPDGRRQTTDTTPAALVDIAPTILDLFGLTIGNDGRVLPLFEAEADDPVEEILTAGSGAFSQRLVRSRIAGRSYLIEGGRA